MDKSAYTCICIYIRMYMYIQKYTELRPALGLAWPEGSRYMRRLFGLVRVNMSSRGNSLQRIYAMVHIFYFGASSVSAGLKT